MGKGPFLDDFGRRIAFQRQETATATVKRVNPLEAQPLRCKRCLGLNQVDQVIHRMADVAGDVQVPKLRSR